MTTHAKRKDFESLGVLDLRSNTADALIQTFQPMGPQRTLSSKPSIGSDSFLGQPQVAYKVVAS